MAEPIITKLEIYDTYEVASENAEMLHEAICYALANPRVYDYRGMKFAVRKTSDKPLCRVVQGKVATEDESATCCECGSQLPLVRPGKHQCDTCEQPKPDLRDLGYLGLILPNVIQSAEYTALYDLIEDTAQTEEEAITLCEEINSWVDAIIARLQSQLKTMTRTQRPTHEPEST